MQHRYLYTINAHNFSSKGEGTKDKLQGKPPYRIKTVIIDPGHGGFDPGTHGVATLEKDLVLSVGKKLRDLLAEKYPQIKVIMTRDKDVFIPLYQRAKIANDANADLFISIHANFMPKSSVTQGTETYVMGLHTAEYNLDVAKRENAAILLEENYKNNYDYDPNSPEGHILFSMYQNAYLDQSIQFGQFVENQYASHANRKSRGVKQAGFVVLKATSMPSVLLEIGFLSNREEENYLKTDNGKQKIAESIFNGFTEYKKKIEQLPETVAEVTNKPTSSPNQPIYQFWIQIAATPNPISKTDSLWKNSPFNIEQLKENGLYKYRTNKFSQIKEVLKARDKMFAAGFKDAFIIVDKNGERISLHQAKKELGIP
ncbi:MAG: N-acetylmuramoyl-L-alanine amidase [Saprospiraceae bacterium]|jgi:N-acetylmuramoyl-L-alanine amidase|nr:N-acetylmuramoyl-L-alanine amidase [Saprospiraceae bacterium]MDP4701360.1 N-acetylmuramoyl-L-alanine amidase [Saprospiraceae bacterium]MDP4812834.1 N-acetylmuramoyl-L-alanine amidase [Saprospiraceae bacterium]MDP4854228.1 N-acetylmuramoyl-L-alanine amidase [Saprospiraceae bacterium]MDP4915064.1 N-acetylmuramoyl-L-alanine amidase [Saprospiraceae bacterium]